MSKVVHLDVPGSARRFAQRAREAHGRSVAAIAEDDYETRHAELAEMRRLDDASHVAAQREAESHRRVQRMLEAALEAADEGGAA